MTSEPTLGRIEVMVRTEGPDQDPDGYTVTLNGDFARIVALSGSSAFGSLPPGEYRIDLASIASNCTADSDHKMVIVRAGETTVAPFLINCAATGAWLRVTVTTNGLPDPDGYVIRVSGPKAMEFRVDPNGSNEIRYPFGEAIIVVEDLAAHCTVEGGDDRKAIVGPDSDVAVDLTINCRDAETLLLGDTTGFVTSDDPGCDNDPETDAPDPCIEYQVTIHHSGTLVVRVGWDTGRWMVLRMGDHTRRYYADAGLVGTLLVREGDVVRFWVGMHDYWEGDSQPFSVKIELIK